MHLKKRTRTRSNNLLLMTALVFILSLLVISGCSTVPIENSPLQGRVDLQGHRGARGLYPENTIPSFRAAMDYGMTTIELDTTLTRDKNLAIYHDVNINRRICLNEKGEKPEPLPIKTLTVEELKKLDCGAVKNKKFPRQKTIKNTRIPTLNEFFAYVQSYEKRMKREPVDFNIEIKFGKKYTTEEIREAARIMVQRVENSGMASRTTVQCFVIELLPEIQKLNQMIRTSALFSPTRAQGMAMYLGFNANRKKIIKKTVEAGADIISPHYLYITPKFVKDCHDKKLLVIPWTVNRKERMVKLLEQGVDGIISDYPDRLAEAYRLYLLEKEESRNR